MGSWGYGGGLAGFSSTLGQFNRIGWQANSLVGAANRLTWGTGVTLGNIAGAGNIFDGGLNQTRAFSGNWGASANIAQRRELFTGQQLTALQGGVAPGVAFRSPGSFNLANAGGTFPVPQGAVTAPGYSAFVVERSGWDWSDTRAHLRDGLQAALNGNQAALQGQLTAAVGVNGLISVDRNQQFTIRSGQGAFTYNVAPGNYEPGQLLRDFTALAQRANPQFAATPQQQPAQGAGATPLAPGQAAPLQGTRSAGANAPAAAQGAAAGGVAPPARTAPTRDENVQKVQAVLERLGVDTGQRNHAAAAHVAADAPIPPAHMDGINGPRTGPAIRQLQTALNIPVTGQADAATVTAIGNLNAEQMNALRTRLAPRAEAAPPAQPVAAAGAQVPTLTGTSLNPAQVREALGYAGFSAATLNAPNGVRTAVERVQQALGREIDGNSERPDTHRVLSNLLDPTQRADTKQMITQEAASRNITISDARPTVVRGIDMASLTFGANNDGFASAAQIPGMRQGISGGMHVTGAPEGPPSLPTNLAALRLPTGRA